jgi:hypothetical protein
VNRDRYALRIARKRRPVTVETWPDAGVVRVQRADGTVVIGRPVRADWDEVIIEGDAPGSTSGNTDSVPPVSGSD